MYRTTGLSLSSSSSVTTAPFGFDTEMLSLKSTLSIEMLLRLMSLPDTLLPLPMLLMEEAIELTLDIVLSVLSVLALLTVESMDSTVFSLKL